MNRTSTLYRGIFQAHLWGGLALGVYALLIGVTGSVLVFHEDILDRIAPVPRIAEASTTPRFETIRAGIESHYPGWHAWSIEPPVEPGEAWGSYIQQGGAGKMVFADAEGRVVGERMSDGTWLGLVERFHSNLLLPRGRLLNGIGGLALVVLASSGMVLWWPARGAWKTAFRIVRRSSWKGWVYDLHRVGGALSVTFVVMFGLTGGYFTWPAGYRSIAALVLPAAPSPPSARGTTAGDRLPIDDLVAAALRTVPDTSLVRVLVPEAPPQPITVVVAHGASALDRRTRTSQLTMDGPTGRVLTVNDYRQRRAADHLISWMSPVHGGRFGGLSIRILWALAGLTLPALFVTGFLMWCNRVIAPRLR